MDKLNFFPHYEILLKSRRKHTTIRLGLTDRYKVGDEVILTVGWDEENAVPVRTARIVNVTRKKLASLDPADLAGESPDCMRKEAIKYVLSAIYRRVVTPEDDVTIVKWKYLPTEKPDRPNPRKVKATYL